MRRILVLFWLLAGLWSGVFLGAQTAPPAAPQHWVTDGPQLLSAAARNGLDQRLQAYERGTGHQVLVWIGDSTGGTPLEDWTVQAFAAWKVGRKGLDDGLILFIFTGDRKLRIEVGYGLEGQLPDAVASRIIRETIVPRLKAGDADGAINAGVDRMLKVVGGDAAAREPEAPVRQPGLPPLGPVTWILIAVVGLVVLALAITHPALAIWLLFNILSGGRGGGGGFGGGGFDGGGGRSGGGGASGSW